MALTLEDLAARVEELAREKAGVEQKLTMTTQHVAALEQELVTLRTAVSGQAGAVAAGPRVSAAVPQERHETGATGTRRIRQRPLTRLGLLGAAAAAGAAAVLPVAAHAQTLDGPDVAPAPQVGTTAPIFSPNGLFKLDVTNGGIFLTGPTGRIELTFAEVIVKNAGPVTIDGTVVRLNNGGKQVARVGDTVQVATINGPAIGTILGPGALTVLV